MILTPILAVMLVLSLVIWYMAYRRTKAVTHGMVS